jgi:hypothetical protein
MIMFLLSKALLKARVLDPQMPLGNLNDSYSHLLVKY